MTTVLLTLTIFATLGIEVVAQPHSADASTGLVYTPLALQNGWTGGAFGTRAPAVATDSNGIVHFKGAMKTTMTNPVAFSLPVQFRPSGPVFLAVDMCNASNGRIQIDATGVTTVEPETSFNLAACFTSLDGGSFAK